MSLKKIGFASSLLLAFFLVAPVIAFTQSELPDAIQPSPSLLSQNQPQNQFRGHVKSSDRAQESPIEPITPAGRFHWFLMNTIGPQSLAAGVVSAGFGTAINKPIEFGPGWKGFGKRSAMRLTGISTQNAMEAGLGSFWGEDPRYFRASGDSFGQRVGHVVKLTFLARRPDGDYQPAYARFIAIPTSNFLSNTWRADSEATNGNAIERTFLGFAGRLAGNAFMEFWPDLRQRIFHRK